MTPLTPSASDAPLPGAEGHHVGDAAADTGEAAKGSAASPALVITVHGTPGPQGSKRHVGRGVLVESSAKVWPWREAVKHAAIDHFERIRCTCPEPLTGPLCVEVTFTVRKPTTAPKRRITWPITRYSGDVDKLLRATLDALTDAGVMRDDSQVVEVVGRKVYPQEGIDALTHPGALIRIWPVSA